MHQRTIPAVILAVVVAVAPAAAQNPAPVRSSQPIVSFQPPDPASWDVAFQAGWLGRNKSEIAPDWNDWYDAGSFGVTAGYYWTPHLKAELGVSASTSGRVLVDNFVFLPGAPFPYPRPREHRFRATQSGAALTYQFFQNRWFHPFVSAGIEATHESEQATEIVGIPYVRDAIPPGVAPPLVSIDTARWQVHPVAGIGFKAYVSERAFIRSDLRGAFSTDRVEWTTLRAGVGVDF